MGYGLRYFIAEDNGVLTRVPAVKCHRWLADDEAVPAERASRELPRIISRPRGADPAGRGAHRRASCKALDTAHRAVL